MQNSERPSDSSLQAGSAIACPTLQVLQEFLSGTSRTDWSPALLSHLETCPHCSKMLDELAQGIRDPLVEAFQHSSGLDEYSSEPDCCDVVRNIAEGKLQSRKFDRPHLSRIGSYEIEEVIAEGGMGIVYRATHSELGKEVAIKLMRTHLPHDLTIIKRFRRECRALGKMQHPNLVVAYDAGVIDGTPFLVMEYVAGVDLGRLLKERGTLSIPDACEIVRQAALGLEHAWGKGVIHRDVKPSNLILTRDALGGGLVKVLDLGLARVVSQAKSAEESSLSSAGQVMGTRAYMAPEQAIDSHSVDIRADIYSLGATLRELLTGRPSISSEQSAVAALMPDSIPESLRAILNRLLAEDRSLRPTTPGEVAILLQPFCEGQRIHDLIV